MASAELSIQREVRCADGVVMLDLATDLFFCRYDAMRAREPGPEPAMPRWVDPTSTAAIVSLGDIGRFVWAITWALATFPGRPLRVLLTRRGWPVVSQRAEPPAQVLAARFERMSLYLPFRPSCLLASYALRRYLRLYGCDADWVIGVQLFPFRAHAWLALDEVLLNERSHLIDEYEPILRSARPTS